METIAQDADLLASKEGGPVRDAQGRLGWEITLNHEEESSKLPQSTEIQDEGPTLSEAGSSHPAFSVKDLLASQAAAASAVGAGLPARVGRFEVAGEIARGGMGVIVRAWDPQIQRYVALKLLHSHLQADDEHVARFYMEARITGRLDHPTIVPIHELGTGEDGRPFFAMRLLESQTLSHLLARRTDLRNEQGRFLRIFEKVAEGVAFAHSQGVIHRDLKPSNIIVGKLGVVKIMDWGLAKCVRENAPLARAAEGVAAPCQDAPAIGGAGNTLFGSILGTPAYLPPEQARGEMHRLDERADVFSLGGILCHILTGRAPYTGDDATKLDQAARAHLAPAFASLEACPAERELVALAKRCLSPEPDDRPRDGDEVVAAVTNYLESDLRRAERDMVRFFELSLDLFCIAGLDGYLRRLNVNFTRLLGYSEEHMLSRPFADFIHPEDLGSTAEAMAALSEGRPVVQFRNRYRHADGHYLVLEWAAKTETESGGNIYAVARVVGPP